MPGKRREIAVGFGRGSFVGDMCGMVKELAEKCMEFFRLSSAGMGSVNCEHATSFDILMKTGNEQTIHFRKYTTEDENTSAILNI